MRRRDCLRIRDVLAGDGMLGRVADGIACVVGDGVASAQKNARHTADAFCDLAAMAVGAGVSMTTYAPKEAEEKSAPGRVPTDEWAGRAQRAAAETDAGPALSGQAGGMLRRLRKLGQLPRHVEVSTGMTRIPRHGGDRGGGSLVRGRRKGGSQYSEAHMTAQCASRGAGIVMAASRMRPGDTVGGTLPLIGSRALAACAAAGLAPLLLMDRGFLGAASVAWPDSCGADWPVPCRNTPRVIAALREFAAGTRPRVPAFWVTGRDGRRIRYTMTVERRKKKSRRGRGAWPRRARTSRLPPAGPASGSTAGTGRGGP